MPDARFLILVLAALAAGRAASGEQNATLSESHRTRVGHAYVLRGFLGIVHTGMDQVTKKLEDKGLVARVYPNNQWRDIAAMIVEQRAHAPSPEPIILIGHSWGADCVIRIADQLKQDHISVDLMVTVDPVTPPAVPSNVIHELNLYRPGGWTDYFPWWRGIPVEAQDLHAPDNLVENVNIRNRPDLYHDDLTHVTVAHDEKIQAVIVDSVMAVCPPTDQWTRSHHVIRKSPTTAPLTDLR